MNRNETLLREAPFRRLLVSLCVPTIVIMVVMVLYNMADVFFIGRLQNPYMIAAVSLCGPLFSILSGLGTLFGSGGCTAISLALGRQDRESVRRISALCCYGALAVGAVFGAAVLLFPAQVCALIGSDETTLPFTREYLRVVALFAPVIIFSNVFMNLVRADGAAKQSMLANLLGTAVNFVFDPVFILALGWGVTGAAAATVLGNIASAAYLVRYARRSGGLSEAEVDRAVERVLTVFYDYLDNRQSGAVFDRDKDHAVAAKIEEECAVLLQNNGVLPPKADAKVAYIGAYAEKPRYQGGGSSHINSSKVTSALSVAQAKGRSVAYVRGFPSDRDEADADGLAKAVEAAKNADVAVIFAGLPDAIESEGYDRKNMDLPACQNALIEAVAAVQPNTVLVLHNGSPVETPWADKAAAILELYLGGQGVGEAADALLFGEANPSGHLAETFPLRVQDNPSWLNFPGDGKAVRYAEGVYVGYRYYDKKEMPVRWAFGHGLSYTTFEIGNIRLDKAELNDDSAVTVSVDVRNTGGRAGKEVVQLYVSDRNGTPDRPVKELKGFAKVALEPGETKTVSFAVDARSLSYYDAALGDWFAPSGTYELLAGDASDHITARAELKFTTKKALPLRISGDTTFGALLADPRTAAVVGQMMQSMSSQAEAFSETDGEGDAGMGAGASEMARAMMQYMPLKSLMSFTPLSEEQLDGILAALKAAVGQKD